MNNAKLVMPEPIEAIEPPQCEVERHTISLFENNKNTGDTENE